METRANYFLVASFVVAIVALSIIGAIWLLDLHPLPDTRAYYEIDFHGSVAGLKVNAPVSLSGIPIGSVRKIELDHEDPSKVHVTIQVEKGVAIKADSVASLDINFMFGDASISITPGSNSASALAVLPGHAYPLIASETSQLQSITTWAADFMQRTIKVSDALLKMLDDANRQAISEGLQTAAEATGRAVGQAEDLGNTIDADGSIVRDAHAQVTVFNTSLVGLRQGIDTARTDLDDADAVVKTVGEWARNLDNTLSGVRDQQLAAARSMMSDFEGFVSNGRDVVHRLARYIDDFERDPTRTLFGKPRGGGYKPK
jgi:phospholipid/cholesterol/gamma-HCH transport system substrate-binding protein